MSLDRVYAVLPAAQIIWQGVDELCEVRDCLICADACVGQVVGAAEVD
jgi:hypothetical protein